MIPVNKLSCTKATTQNKNQLFSYKFHIIWKMEKPFFFFRQYSNKCHENRIIFNKNQNQNQLIWEKITQRLIFNWLMYTYFIYFLFVG